MPAAAESGKGSRQTVAGSDIITVKVSVDHLDIVLPHYDMARLQKICKSEELPTGGQKEELIRRIKKHGTTTYWELAKEDLRRILQQMGLSIKGTETDLVRRILENSGEL
ncbi:hypothetical protein DFJ74DRAFT_645319 [Hyaloraphidium curvatum]|nr:hypothetical protein DFJ74DRAFT_645319 [Hyaloraphidium curvatum]